MTDTIEKNHVLLEFPSSDDATAWINWYKEVGEDSMFAIDKSLSHLGREKKLVLLPVSPPAALTGDADDEEELE